MICMWASSSFFVRTQHKAMGVASLAEGTADVMPSAGKGRNLEFVHGAGDSLPTCHEGHRGIFSIHQRMLADGTLV